MADDTETKPPAPQANKAADLFAVLPLPELQRVRALPDRGAVLLRNGDRALAVRRMGDKLRAIEAKADAELADLLRKLLGKKKPRGAADVDVSAVRDLLN